MLQNVTSNKHSYNLVNLEPEAKQRSLCIFCENQLSITGLTCCIYTTLILPLNEIKRKKALSAKQQTDEMI